jgi:hypothetical protein
MGQDAERQPVCPGTGCDCHSASSATALGSQASTLRCTALIVTLFIVVRNDLLSSYIVQLVLRNSLASNLRNFLEEDSTTPTSDQPVQKTPTLDQPLLQLTSNKPEALW